MHPYLPWKSCSERASCTFTTSGRGNKKNSNSPFMVKSDDNRNIAYIFSRKGEHFVFSKLEVVKIHDALSEHDFHDK